MMVAGIGCRNGATAEAMAEAIAAALERCGIERVVDRRAGDELRPRVDEAGIVATARRLGVPLDLRRREAR